MDWIPTFRLLTRRYPQLATKPNLRAKVRELRALVQAGTRTEAVLAAVPPEARDTMRAWLESSDRERLTSKA